MSTSKLNLKPAEASNHGPIHREKDCENEVVAKTSDKTHEVVSELVDYETSAATSEQGEPRIHPTPQSQTSDSQPLRNPHPTAIHHHQAAYHRNFPQIIHNAAQNPLQPLPIHLSKAAQPKPKQSPTPSFEKPAKTDPLQQHEKPSQPNHFLTSLHNPAVPTPPQVRPNLLHNSVTPSPPQDQPNPHIHFEKTFTPQVNHFLTSLHNPATTTPLQVQSNPLHNSEKPVTPTPPHNQPSIHTLLVTHQTNPHNPETPPLNLKTQVEASKNLPLHKTTPHLTPEDQSSLHTLLVTPQTNPHNPETPPLNLKTQVEASKKLPLHKTTPHLTPRVTSKPPPLPHHQTLRVADEAVHLSPRYSAMELDTGPSVHRKGKRKLHDDCENKSEIKLKKIH